MRNNALQIQIIIVALEDAKYTNKNIYLTYVYYNNAFGSIDKPRSPIHHGGPKDIHQLPFNYK